MFRSVCAIILLLGQQDAVSSFTTTPIFPASATSSSVQHSNVNTQLFMAKSRKARRQQKVEKQGKSRPDQFYEAIEDAKGNAKESNETVTGSNADQAAFDAEREARAQEARERMEARPEVSTMIVDEETGIEIVAQGKSVMDVVTRKAVKLSDAGPDYRLAQMFPGVPPDVRAKYRMDWNTVEVPEMVEALRAACSVTLNDGTVGIPPHPSVANKGIDFVLANRDYLGRRMKKTLGRLQMRSMWKGNKDEARELQKLWKNFWTLENHISAPFRQIIMDGEGKVGPNFGNLDIASFCSGELYERVSYYIVLKAMVAHWEKKVRDAAYVERTPMTDDNFMTLLCTGDPRRYLPDPPILYTLKECTQVCGMAQQMCKAFTDNAELFDDFPPELRFLERAISIEGGTALRKYMIEDFCPAEGITPEGLREGMRRLFQQLENMQIDPYADITNIVEKLMLAMAVGTEDERDPYKVYLANLDPDGPGYFQTYTFNHDQLSLVRFLDQQYEREGKAETPAFELPNFFGFGEQTPPNRGDRQAQTSKNKNYKVPEERAAGRPHELGWLELLDDENDPNMKLGKIPPGTVIME